MKKILALCGGLLLVFSGLWAQSGFALQLEEVTFPEAPSLQSYAYGVYEGKWLLIGGKTNGLHDHRPPFSFLPATRNDQLWVIDPQTQELWSKPLDELPESLAEQLASTNMEFEQWEEHLALVGGYGYHTGLDEWLTHPFLTVVNLPLVINGVINNTSVAEGFFQIQQEEMAVTGGSLQRLDDVFFLIGGHRFDGRYNPNDGPSFVQEYTDAIRKFQLEPNGDEWELTNFEETLDPANMHRRDLNVLPQVFPDGSAGFTAFTGVFQYGVDIPWMNTVNIYAEDYEVVSDFEQLFNQYHTAHLGVYDGALNEMHNLFFGGIGMYEVDEEGMVWVDSLVPFVNTISRVTRAADGSLAEYILEDEMPGLLGASAELILAEDTPQAELGVIDLGALPAEPTLVGYIFGGIESAQSNIFMQFSGSSEASNRMFEVWIHRGVNGAAARVDLQEGLLSRVFPNPTRGQLTVEGQAAQAGTMTLQLLDTYGRAVWTNRLSLNQAGYFQESLTIDSLPAGKYYLEAILNDQHDVRRIVIE